MYLMFISCLIYLYYHFKYRANDEMWYRFVLTMLEHTSYYLILIYGAYDVVVIIYPILFRLLNWYHNHFIYILWEANSYWRYNHNKNIIFKKYLRELLLTLCQNVTTYRDLYNSSTKSSKLLILFVLSFLLSLVGC